ncbi:MULTISPECIES: YraN family protein [Cyanophyceae]|uniref:YraN family protein n=1 Tax=Cyanophyceae TaxID=3028117 RepID=UPI00232E694F|nr:MULTISPECIES: YraN family protein [Cyanophyceae]MDB9355838.1 YraN family protein [Nodularia spumigena CS-587/03]MDB9317161.1 YraN family protein [Nodularia spumigena CS-590/01A]MDB9323818.1 YraN family protein [Nodularia spumigena CS-591/07A]MDB9328629.1 YraN family protein [Nodularia spumigena CS-590/02]MDB9329681.1 YraN family protein [Nodularia spumigena CS-591/04]
MTNPPPSHYPDIGELGEDLVAQWLHSTGWEILHRRFSSRWGEIDIIAQLREKNLCVHQLPQVAFVEVKTRSQRNWDLGGKCAITRQKQAKIERTATIFLAEYPEKADYPCRFDVAIVYCQRISKQRPGLTLTPEPLASLSADGYQFYLQEYLPAAFDSVDG